MLAKGSLLPYYFIKSLLNVKETISYTYHFKFNIGAVPTDAIALILTLLCLPIIRAKRNLRLSSGLFVARVGMFTWLPVHAELLINLFIYLDNDVIIKQTVRSDVQITPRQDVWRNMGLGKMSNGG